jgi:hypothetical protein
METKLLNYIDSIIVAYLKHDLPRARLIVKEVISELGNGNRDIFIRALLPEKFHLHRDPVKKPKQSVHILRDVREG